MSNATAKYKEARAKMVEAKKQIKKTANDAFTEMSADFFENNPAILSLCWAQYTPYWNDGDTCTFSANTNYPSFTFEAKDGKTLHYDENMSELTVVGSAVRDEEEDIEYSEDDQIDQGPYEKEIDKHAKAVISFLNVFEEEDLEVMFGDHMKITVNRNGKVKTEEYEHE